MRNHLPNNRCRVSGGRRFLGGGLAFLIAWAALPIASGRADETQQSLSALEAVGTEGKGSVTAAKAWRQLSRSGPDELLAMFAALDGAAPLEANWIRTAIDAVGERLLAEDGLPIDQLGTFLADRGHAPKARRLAYEWILAARPEAKDALVASMLDDPSVELRYEAVSEVVTRAEQLAADNRKEEALQAYQTALDAARNLDQVTAIAETLEASGVSVDRTELLGAVTRWKLIGPFDNTGEAGFDVAYPPEAGIDFASSYPGKHGDVRWTDHETEDPWGWVKLNDALAEEKGVCAYAATEFFATEPIDVEIRMGSYNAVKVWVNGEQVIQQNIYHAGAFLDQYVGRARLKKGRNLILVKICQNEQTQSWAEFWEFQLRVCDAIGGGIRSSRP